MAFVNKSPCFGARLKNIYQSMLIFKQDFKEKRKKSSLGLSPQWHFRPWHLLFVSALKRATLSAARIFSRVRWSRCAGETGGPSIILVHFSIAPTTKPVVIRIFKHASTIDASPEASSQRQSPGLAGGCRGAFAPPPFGAVTLVGWNLVVLALRGGTFVALHVARAGTRNSTDGGFGALG